MGLGRPTAVSCKTSMVSCSLLVRSVQLMKSCISLSFDSVSSCIHAFRIKERELAGTPYHPGGEAILDISKKLTPAVCKYVQNNAPEE